MFRLAKNYLLRLSGGEMMQDKRGRGAGYAWSKKNNF